MSQGNGTNTSELREDVGHRAVTVELNGGGRDRGTDLEGDGKKVEWKKKVGDGPMKKPSDRI